MTARERRQVVGQVQAVRGVSERRAIRYTGFPRSTMRYRSIRDPQELLQLLAAAQNYTDVAAQNCTLDDFVAARRGA